MSRMQRRRFLAGLASTGAMLVATHGRAARGDTVPASVRVKLFAADDLERVDISGVHIDLSSQPTAVSARPGAVVVTAYLSDGSTVHRHYEGVIRTSGAG